MKKRVVAMVLGLVLAVGSLTGCGAKEAQLVGSYTSATSTELEYGGTVLGNNYGSYALHLFDDNTYTMTYTDVAVISDALGGSTAITSYGTYEKGESADGYLSVTLSAADRLVYDSYSTMGGYSMGYDTNVDETYIIPGGDDSEISKQEFMEQLGYASPTNIKVVLNSSNAETSQFEIQAD